MNTPHLRALLLSTLLFSCAPAHAEPPGGNTFCEPPDKWSIRDDGPDRAILTYSNSEAGCSTNVDTMLTSENGIQVRVIILANPADASGAERFDAVPQDPNMMAFPPSVDVADGDTQEIVVQGGMS